MQVSGSTPSRQPTVETVKGADTSAPSSPIHASKKIPEKAPQISTIALKSMPKENDLMAALRGVAHAFEKSAVGRFFSAVADKISSLVTKHIVAAPTVELSQKTLNPIDLRAIDHGNSKLVDKTIHMATSYQEIQQFHRELTELYQKQDTPNPARQAELRIAQAVETLPKEQVKVWNKFLGEQQDHDFLYVFEGAKNDEELIANIEAVKKENGDAKFCCRLRGMVAANLANGSREVAGIAVAREFFQLHIAAGKEELASAKKELLQAEINVKEFMQVKEELDLYAENPEKAELTKAVELSQRFRKSGDTELQATFDAMCEDRELLRTYIDALRKNANELQDKVEGMQADLASAEKQAPNPALQKALTS